MIICFPFESLLLNITVITFFIKNICLGLTYRCFNILCFKMYLHVENLHKIKTLIEFASSNRKVFIPNYIEVPSHFDPSIYTSLNVSVYRNPTFVCTYFLHAILFFYRRLCYCNLTKRWPLLSINVKRADSPRTFSIYWDRDRKIRVHSSNENIPNLKLSGGCFWNCWDLPSTSLTYFFFF